MCIDCSSIGVFISILIGKLFTRHATIAWFFFISKIGLLYIRIPIQNYQASSKQRAHVYDFIVFGLIRLNYLYRLYIHLKLSV